MQGLWGGTGSLPYEESLYVFKLEEESVAKAVFRHMCFRDNFG